MTSPGLIRTAIVLTTWLALVAAALGQQGVKWRTPKAFGTATPAPSPTSAVRAPALLSPPVSLAPQTSVAQQLNPPANAPSVRATPGPFLPPMNDLPAPALPSVVVPQPSTLPPPVAVGPTDGFDPLGSFFAHADDTLPEIEEWEQNTPPLVSHIMPSKPGFFQKFGLSGGWVEGGTEGRAPAIADLSTYTTYAVPFPIREWPLYITPGGDVRTIDGPKNPDLPPTLYDAYVDFSWNLRITQRSTHTFSVAPGYYSDFQRSDEKSFRITGKWASAYDVVKNRITLLSGTIYLGRDDIQLLPMGGLVFTPNDWTRFEAVFPSPRASLRLRANESFEDWIYTGADFYNGQTYGIERANNTVDRVTILDNRAVLGYERRRNGGAGWFLESGWVFDRDVRYRNNPHSNFSPDNTYYFRAGFTL